MSTILALKHPNYTNSFSDYCKWRLTMESGDTFRNKYLKKFSIREDDDDFASRKDITYVPSFASAAVTEIVNAIYQRMSKIQRLGGPASYQSAITGVDGGVDLLGSSMNTYIGQQVIIELLSMSKVGVFVDKPPIHSNILADNQKNIPYLYLYRVEDILSWNFANLDNEQTYTNILLKDCVDSYDADTGLVNGTIERYRRMWLVRDGVKVQFYNYKGEEDSEIIILPIKRIPFVLFSMDKSLLVDAANYQIALMNLSSSDLAYLLKANFPFYTEQQDSRANSAYLQQSEMVEAGGMASPLKSKYKEVKVGGAHGRTYAQDMDRPGFISPSSEPLLASMKKEEQIKDEIRQLINLSLSSLKSTHASAESKGMDDRSLEGGLASIGLELQHGENQISKIWAMYENTKPAQVKYPARYSMMSETDRREEINQLKELRDIVPSLTCRKEISKKIAKLTLENDVSDDILEKIMIEVDKADYITADSEDIRNDVEAGLCDAVTASNARGYDGKNVVPQAQKEHAERLARISESQGGGNNGVNDLGGDGKLNRQRTPPDTKPKTDPPVRGKGR